jgi:hypothetical protein
MARDKDTLDRTDFSNEGMVPHEGASGRSFDLRLQNMSKRSYCCVEDDTADSSASMGTFTPRVGVGREMPNFFIL